MFGELGASRDAAERAVALAPELARTQMVLGFAALTRIDIDQAKASFERAIALDSADPLPRLGLGLAHDPQRRSRGGRRELEIAAALDPNNSLLRSYLGKAYFEERRDPLDAEQFAIAKELDPNDPTPWFYDAIRLQTENRPVEALRDLERSIELNDNRAVYRSRLLLDEDRATRGTSLARIYDDLGFEQLGVNEATQVADARSGQLVRAPLSLGHLCRRCRGTRSRGSASCCRRSCCSRSTSIRSSRASALTDLNIVARGGPARAALQRVHAAVRAQPASAHRVRASPVTTTPSATRWLSPGF